MRPVTLIPWEDWIQELAVLRHLVPGIDRLSGVGMRNHYYFGTRPGNHEVAVSSIKGG